MITFFVGAFVGFCVAIVVFCLILVGGDNNGK